MYFSIFTPCSPAMQLCSQLPPRRNPCTIGNEINDTHTLSTPKFRSTRYYTRLYDMKSTYSDSSRWKRSLSLPAIYCRTALHTRTGSQRLNRSHGHRHVAWEPENALFCFLKIHPALIIQRINKTCICYKWWASSSLLTLKPILWIWEN